MNAGIDIAKRRYNRAAQARHRGGGSLKTDLENACILLAWAEGHLSEGQVAAVFDTDRLTVRRMRDDAVQLGMGVAGALCPAEKPKEQGNG